MSALPEFLSEPHDVRDLGVIVEVVAPRPHRHPGRYDLRPEQVVDPRDLDLLQVLNAMPPLYPFRREPRYQALLARIGLPERLRR